MPDGISPAFGVATGPGAGADPLGDDVISSPDTSGAHVGLFNDLVLDDDGRPAIAYYDLTNGDLKVLRCSNVDCSGTQTPSSPDTTGDVGWYPSIAIDSMGIPVIAYYDSTEDDLEVLRCSNVDCSGAQTPSTPDSAGDVGQFASLALNALGNPVVAYYDSTNGDLKLLACTNADCSGAQTPRTVVSGGDVGRNLSMRLDSAGRPVILFHDQTELDTLLVHCTTTDCSGPQSSTVVDLDGAVHTSLVLDADGNPVASYYDPNETALAFVRCAASDCSGDPSVLLLDEDGDTGLDTGLALDHNDRPVISYFDGTDSDLKVLYCSNPGCTGAQSPLTPDSAGFVGASTSLALDANGNAVVSYYDGTNDTIKVLHCYDADGCGGQDQDLDGVAHADDNCPADANTSQTDSDGDGVGDACDPTPTVPIPALCAGFDGANVVVGTPGDDTLVGTAGSDVIIARGGDDVIRGLGGDDCIIAGAGNDRVNAGRGDDLVYGGGGADVIRGRAGADILRGGRGPDTLFGNPGGDVLNGDRGRDTLDGGPGFDQCGSGTRLDQRCEAPLD